MLIAKRTAWGKLLRLAPLLILTVVLAWPYVLFNRDKLDSDYIRMETLEQVIDATSPLSLAIGNGLGVGVQNRPVHMEVAYLEMFHKQGLVGLLWITSVFAVLCTRYVKARHANHPYAEPLFLSALFVAIESVTNPFINNPIGICVWIIALVGLDVITKVNCPQKVG